MAVDGNSDPEDMSKKEEAASTGNDDPKVICRTCIHVVLCVYL